MADFFIEPDDGLDERPEIEQQEGEDDTVYALCSLAIAEIRGATDQLATGDISVDAWYDQMVDIIAAYLLAGWYVGTGDDTDPTDDQLDRVANVMATQVEYLDGFKADLLAEPDEQELSGAYRNRAEMYGYAVGQGIFVGMAKDYDLPAYPRDTTATCGHRCKCRWEIIYLDEQAGDIDAFWYLGVAEHCPECPERALDWSPFQIRGGEWVPGQVGAKHYK